MAAAAVSQAAILRKKDEFLAFVKSRHGTDPRVQKLLVRLRGVLFGQAVSWNDGVVTLATWNAAQKRNYTEPEVLGALLHGLAHAATFDSVTGVHGETWRHTYFKFLNIASSEMRWKVQLGCGECKAYGVCDPKACQACLWPKPGCNAAGSTDTSSTSTTMSPDILSRASMVEWDRMCALPQRKTYT